MALHIGTAGYVYPHWRRGAFYPRAHPPAKELSYYLAHFPAVEINATWHAFPRISTLARWRAAAHPRSVFALKAPAAITHTARLRDVSDAVRSFCRVANDGLADNLGPLLFQCPPSLPLSIPLLQLFLDDIAAANAQLGARIRVALEFRSPDWFCPRVYHMLAARDVALVNNIAVTDADFAVLDPAIFPHARDEPPHPEASWRYNRFHGSKNPGVLTDFPDHVLLPFARQTAEQYAFFLNDWGAVAPRNAQRYARLCARERGTHVRHIFDGFVPEWTRRKTSIASFFKKAADDPHSAPANSSSATPTAGSLLTKERANTTDEQTPPVATEGKPVAVPVVNSTSKLEALKPVSPSPVVASSKKIATPIQKKRKKTGAKDIASYFSVASDKG